MEFSGMDVSRSPAILSEVGFHRVPNILPMPVDALFGKHLNTSLKTTKITA
jgi:hypothetical protein